jgi:hypothetical protein
MACAHNVHVWVLTFSRLHLSRTVHHPTSAACKTPPSGPEWLHEIKLGWRCHAHIDREGASTRSNPA